MPDLYQPEQQDSKCMHAWDISIQQCCFCCAGDSIPSTMDSSMNLGTQAGHSRSTTSAMTVSDQSTTTGFSDSLPVMHQRDTSDVSALSGLPSGEMPGPSGAYCLLFSVIPEPHRCTCHVLPVMHQPNMSDVSVLSGLSGEMPGPSGANSLFFLSSLSPIAVPIICWLPD